MPIWGLLWFADTNLEPQVLLRVSMNINLSTLEPPFVFQISQSSNFGKKWFFIQNLQMDFSFQEKKTVCNSHDTGEFMRFFKHPV